MGASPPNPRKIKNSTVLFSFFLSFLLNSFCAGLGRKDMAAARMAEVRMAEVLWREVLACLEVQEAHKLCCVSKRFNAACRGSFRKLHFQRVRGHPTTFARLCATAHEVTVPRGTYVHKLGSRVHTLSGAANIPATMRDARALDLHGWFYFAPKLLAHASTLQTLALDSTCLCLDFLSTFRQLPLLSSLTLSDFSGPINRFDLADRSALRHLHLSRACCSPPVMSEVTLPDNIISVLLTDAIVLNASVPPALLDLRLCGCSWPLSKLNGVQSHRNLRYRLGKEDFNVYIDEQMAAKHAVPENIEHLSLYYTRTTGHADFTHKLVLPTTLRVLCLSFVPAHVDCGCFTELVNVTALRLYYCSPVLPAAFFRRLVHLCIFDSSDETTALEVQIGHLAKDLTALQTLNLSYCSLHMPGADFVPKILSLFAHHVQIFRGGSLLNRTLVTCKPVASPWEYVVTLDPVQM